jgi:hypothetical protein
MAYVTMEFSGWASLEQKCRDIIIARCSATPEPNAVGADGIEINMRGLINSDMEIVSVLAGTKNSGHVKLTSEYWPRQGECYLIFAYYHDGFYQAFESYKVVPLGPRFVTNGLGDKSVEEQIQMLFQRRLNDLKREMKNDQEEKQRLEEALNK